ncbi:MAG: InlB B-repeat-containing protein, partial [Acholeplasmatales bacterium]|nr:InlB B-repeat-containing protein [Acholeplasmatales bacterium]
EISGWYTNQSLTTLWDFENDTVNEDITLYALWAVYADANITFSTTTIATSKSATEQNGTVTTSNSEVINVSYLRGYKISASNGFGSSNPCLELDASSYNSVPTGDAYIIFNFNNNINTFSFKVKAYGNDDYNNTASLYIQKYVGDAWVNISSNLKSQYSGSASTTLSFNNINNSKIRIFMGNSAKSYAETFFDDINFSYTSTFTPNMSVTYSGTNNINNVTSNITLVNGLVPYFMSTPVWSSNNPSIVISGSNGIYYEPSGTTQVTITASYTLNGIASHTDFIITVKTLVVANILITFDINDSSYPETAVWTDTSVLQSFSVPVGTIITKPSDPTMSGYTFLGWFEGELQYTSWSSILYENLTLEAHWLLQSAESLLKHSDFGEYNSTDSLYTTVYQRDITNGSLDALPNGTSSYEIKGGNANSSSWAYMAFGAKDVSSTEATPNTYIKTNFVFTSYVTKISFEYSTLASPTLTSIVLQTSSTIGGTYTTIGSFSTSASSTLNMTSLNISPNNYIKFILVHTSNGTNGRACLLTNIKFYGLQSGGGGDNPGEDIDPNIIPYPQNSSYSQTTNEYEIANFSSKNTGLPSKGTYHVPVIFVDFTNDRFTSSEKQKAELAFNGTSAGTGWESVSTWFTKSSYGALNLTFDFVGTYSSTKNSSYYDDSGEGNELGDQVAIAEAMAYINPFVDFSIYDYNNDGNIDSIYFIYSVADNYDIDPWWAWVSLFNESPYTFDGKDLWYYQWASISFASETLHGATIPANAETYIHETGHLLGSEDYYSYNSTYGGLGGMDMQACNVGDHGPYNKMMYGWVKPYIASSSSSKTFNLKEYEQANESDVQIIVIPRSGTWNLYSEYIAIVYYTPTVLYEHAATRTSGWAKVVPNDRGVLIYHIDARHKSSLSYWNYYIQTNVSSYGPDYIVEILQADKASNIHSVGMQAKDLLRSGSINLNTWTWNQGGAMNIIITVNSKTSSNINITLTVS